MNAIKLFLLSTIALCSLSLQAEIYSWVDEEGNRVFSDKNPRGEQSATTHSLSNKANYYSALPGHSRPDPDSSKAAIGTTEILSVQETASTEQDAEMSEEECRSIYGLNCNRVNNWQNTALQECYDGDTDEERCEDPLFLERKYKPLPLAEIRHRANNAGARRNAQERKLIRFLDRKYGDQCKMHLEYYCSRKPDSSACEGAMIQVCEDDRSVEEMLARYDKLTPLQRQRVLALADEMSPTLDYEKATRILGDIVELISLASGI